jgi:hypothetical protein
MRTSQAAGDLLLLPQILEQGRMTKRAKTYDEIKPLIELCKNGRLFDVQAWIKASHPINSPPPPELLSRTFFKKLSSHLAKKKAF